LECFDLQQLRNSVYMLDSCDRTSIIDPFKLRLISPFPATSAIGKWYDVRERIPNGFVIIY
jgi:hypothetical protein